jgi:hypothetical protein
VWPFGSQLSERSLGKITVRGNVFPFGSQLSERSLRKITVGGNVFKTTLPSPLIFFKKSSHIIKYVWFAPHMLYIKCKLWCKPCTCIFQINPHTYIIFFRTTLPPLLGYFFKSPPTSLNVSGLHGLHQVVDLHLICSHKYENISNIICALRVNRATSHMYFLNKTSHIHHVFRTTLPPPLGYF